jgi:hypothetical protein
LPLGTHGGGLARSTSVEATVILVNSFSLLEATGELKVRVLEPERNFSAALAMYELCASDRVVAVRAILGDIHAEELGRRAHDVDLEALNWRSRP